MIRTVILYGKCNVLDQNCNDSLNCVMLQHVRWTLKTAQKALYHVLPRRPSRLRIPRSIYLPTDTPLYPSRWRSCGGEGDGAIAETSVLLVLVFYVGLE